MVFKEFYKGIDSLYVSFRGVLKDEIKGQLESRKWLAQSGDVKDQCLAYIDIDGHSFEVKDKGKGSYAYVLVDGWFNIQITASVSRKFPEIYVQLSSDILHCFGLSVAMDLLRGTIKQFVREIESESISRADFFVDFGADINFELVKKREWVTRADDIDSHWRGKYFTGWSIGPGGVIYARIYDKTIEIMKSGKEYFKDIWARQNWTEGETVWRLEYQLKRDFLNQMSINSISDLMSMSNDVWKYCTHDWLRLAVESPSEENRSRWNTNPVWQFIQQVTFGDGTYTGILRHVDKSRVPSDKTLYLNGLGYLTAFAAREGYADVAKAIPEFMKKSHNFLHRYVASGKKYRDGYDYLDIKINLKKKRYNKV